MNIVKLYDNYNVDLHHTLMTKPQTAFFSYFRLALNAV